MDLFAKLGSYEEYLQANPLHEILNVDLSQYGEIEAKIDKTVFHSVDPSLNEAYATELDDLIRLHYLVISRKVTTILEFGVGKSSVVFDHALKINKKVTPIL